MNWIRFLKRARTGAEQREELEFHIEVTTDEYIARGMEPVDARNAARKKLGNATSIEEEIYRMDTVKIADGLLRDARQSLRMIRLNPAFSLAAILSLALGIGANTAIFSIVNAVLIRPLPYPEPGSLVGVYNSAVIQGETFSDMGLGPGMYAALKEQSAAFREFGVWSSGIATVTGTGNPEQVKVIRMTQGVLPTLGAQPFLGRSFSIDDDTPGTAETVILSHSYWANRFGSSEQVLGREVVIDSVVRRVIGVMPWRFRFLDLSPDVLLPQRFARTNLPFEPFSYSGIARLKAGITIDRANQDVARVLKLTIPEKIRPFLEQSHMQPNLRPLRRDVIGDIGTALTVLMVALLFVFMLVCANVANLVLVRAQARTQEFALRAALGAGWNTIARQLLTETLTLGLAGGSCGIILAYVALQILKTQDLTSIPRLTEVSLDPLTLAFALGCSIVCSIFFGLIAVLKYGIPGRFSHARGASLSHTQVRGQNLLAVTQVALTLVLLVASGLLIRSFLALRSVNPGFTQPGRIQILRVAIPETQVSEPERVARMQIEILHNISAIQGVEAAGAMDGLPMEADYRNGNIIAVEDKFVPGQTQPNRDVKYISPGLFAALGSQLLAGRDFEWRDVFSHHRVAIVSENMARENWGEPQAALGKRLKSGALVGDPWFDIVGVVENVHDYGPDKQAPEIVYFRTGVYDSLQPGRPQSIRRGLSLAIRSGRANTNSFLQDIARAIHRVDPNLPLTQARTLDDVYRRSMARTLFTVCVLGVAGSMAFILSIIGVYGVLAYAVAQRRREVGIRMALGAQPKEVQSLFVRRGVLVAGVGIVNGLAVTLSLSRWVSSLLFGVTAFDPGTYLISICVVFLAVLVASYVPARGALSIDPVESLRVE